MLEFDEIKRFSSVYAGAIALAVFVIRKMAGYVEYLFFPVVRANRAFREGILSFVRMGIAPTKEELQILKRGVSERYAISPCQMATVYSVLMDIYTETLCSKDDSTAEKRRIRAYLINYGKEYRDKVMPYKTDRKEFVRDLVFTMIVMSLTSSANLLYKGVAVNESSVLLLVGIGFCGASIFNILLNCIFVRYADSQQRRKALKAILAIRCLSHQRV